ncbi:MAG TPA: peptidylprolyl isomerase [Amaricoccus sp.]|nr:peptidylprolyl isomerase [Amaricoccus sp.]
MSGLDTRGEPPRLVPDRRPPAARAQRAPRLTPPPSGMPGACQTGGCGGPEPALPPPPSFGEVRVDGTEIAPEAIAGEIQHHPAPDAETAWREAARALVIRELLLREARRCGIEPEPEADEAGRRESEDDALIRALLDEAVVPAEPDEAECRRFFEARRDRFRTPDLFEVAHVLIEPARDDPDAWDAAETQARAVIAEVGDDAAAFAAAARELSACPSAQQDGSLGQVRRGELLPVVQAALEAIPEGTTRREPVRSPHGWHVLRLHRRIAGRALPYEVVSAKIAETLGARSWSLAATRYVAGLAAGADIRGVTVEPAGQPGIGPGAS